MKEVLAGYKGQDKVEKGFAFLKGSDFFTSSLFLKKATRIKALCMIMVLSLLIYSIAQRRLRKKLDELGQTLPNQIQKEVKNPTMRWIFQIFHDINYVTITINGVTTEVIQGVDQLHQKILNLLGHNVQAIYQKSFISG